MSDHQEFTEIKMGSERGFGIVFSIVFTIIALWPLLGNGSIREWAIITSIVFIVIAFTKPRLFKYPNILWFKFGILLGRIVTPIIMTLLYSVAIIPIGILIKIMRKDLLRLKLEPNSTSYWIERKDPVGTMKNQF